MARCITRCSSTSVTRAGTRSSRQIGGFTPRRLIRSWSTGAVSGRLQNMDVETRPETACISLQRQCSETVAAGHVRCDIVLDQKTRPFFKGSVKA